MNMWGSVPVVLILVILDTFVNLTYCVIFIFPKMALSWYGLSLRHSSVVPDWELKTAQAIMINSAAMCGECALAQLASPAMLFSATNGVRPPDSGQDADT